MNTALIIICIAFAVAIVAWALTHFGTAIALDKRARDRGVRERSGRGATGNRPTT